MGSAAIDFDHAIIDDSGGVLVGVTERTFYPALLKIISEKGVGNRCDLVPKQRERSHRRPLALRLDLHSGSEVIPWGSARGALTAQDPQGSAACCSRAATLTASPVTRNSPAPGSRVATTSPVFTPMRMGRRRPSLGSA